MLEIGIARTVLALSRFARLFLKFVNSCKLNIHLTTYNNKILLAPFEDNRCSLCCDVALNLQITEL